MIVSNSDAEGIDDVVPRLSGFHGRHRPESEGIPAAACNSTCDLGIQGKSDPEAQCDRSEIVSCVSAVPGSDIEFVT